MEIKVTHVIELGTDTRAFLTQLLSGVPGQLQRAEPPAASSKKNTPAKTEVTPAPATPPAAEETGDTDVITFEMLKAQFSKNKAAGKNDGNKALLAELGVKGLTDLKEAQYLYVYNKACAL